MIHSSRWNTMIDGLRIEVNVREHMLEFFEINVLRLGQRGKHGTGG